MKFFQTLFALASIATGVLCQNPVPIPANDLPFALDGGIDAMAATDATKFNSGGTLNVNGWTITIPDNLQVNFPAAFVPWKDFAADKSYIGYEISVVGNVVNGKPIAGIVDVGQFLLQGSSGYVESVNFDGTLKIKNGPTIRANDPNGIFGKAYTGRPFMTADDENPSITAFSGFPMCIPRSATDELCPPTNRPNKAQGTFNAVDSLIAAPFLPGDYVEYSGFRDGDGVIVCYEIVAANVQILTTGKPTYIRIEDALIGVFDGTPGEFADTRFIGYVSDASAALTINARDIDPCTGEITDRIIGSATVRNAAGDQRNKFVFRTDSTQLTHYTREYRLVLNSGQVTTKNGFVAGQYVQPVTEWVFPEPLNPATPIPIFDFSQMDHLTKGTGPDDDGNIFGPLKPFPMSTKSFADPVCAKPVPSAPSTPTPTPTPTGDPVPKASATISPGNVCISGKTYKLTGSNTNTAVPANAVLTHAWSITGPAAINPATPSAATTTFVAPTTAGIYTVTYKLCSGTLCDSTTLTFSVSAKDTVTITSYTWTSTQGGTISVTAKTSIPYPAPDNAVLTLCLANACNIAMTNQGNGVWSYNARSTKRPTSITVNSSLGGTATTTTTTARKRQENGFAFALEQRRSLGNSF